MLGVKVSSFRIRIGVFAGVLLACVLAQPAFACTYALCEAQCWEEAESIKESNYHGYYSRCLVTNPGEYVYCDGFAREKAADDAATYYSACERACKEGGDGGSKIEDLIFTPPTLVPNPVPSPEPVP